MLDWIVCFPPWESPSSSPALPSPRSAVPPHPHEPQTLDLMTTAQAPPHAGAACR